MTQLPDAEGPGAELAWDQGHALGEGVLWDGRQGLWWWTDILGARLWRAAEGGVPQSRRLPQGVGSFALTHQPDRLLLAMEDGLAHYHWASGGLQRIDAGLQLHPGTRLNDGRCDRAGHFVFGSMELTQAQPWGRWWRYQPDGALAALDLPAVVVANSCCFSPDGGTFYFCDSPARQIMACDYAPASGRISHLRVFVDSSDQPGVPDGSCIDAQGCLWNARWGAGKVQRFRPDGTLDREVAVPVAQPSCVAIGGEGLDRLCISSAHVGLSAEQRRQQPWAGGLFCLRLGQPLGLPESRFGADGEAA